MPDTPPVQLVPDWCTDHVLLVLPTAEMVAYDRFLQELELFYADFVRELARHDSVACLVPDGTHVEKMMRLSGLGPEFFPQATVPDIWIRDFAPISARGRSVQFRYDPCYLPKWLNREVEEAMRAFLAACAIPTRREKRVLEGGNLVHNGAGVGLATRSLIARNRGRARGIAEHVRQALGLEQLVLVPREPGDQSGHVDGMLQWGGSDLLLVNDYGRLEGGLEFHKKLCEVLDGELPQVQRVMLPYCWSSSKLDGWWDARGNYANFLMTARRVYVPVYGMPEDREAKEVFEGLFPGRVSYVHAEAIARYGGSLHCITWNYAGAAAPHPIGDAADEHQHGNRRHHHG